jgi:hypothetical protein
MPSENRFWIDVADRPDIDLLRTVIVAVGLSRSVAFVVIGLGYELELFGDGSIFSYSVAVDDAWAIRWHNDDDPRLNVRVGSESALQRL